MRAEIARFLRLGCFFAANGLAGNSISRRAATEKSLSSVHPIPMTLDETMQALAVKGSEATKRVLAKHGAKEPFFGVKISDLKVIHKKIKGDQPLALQLYATGISDAQYLAGMVADGRKMTVAQLDTWAKTASWHMISGTTVPWVASEHPEGIALALTWIDAEDTGVMVAGWATLTGLVATMPDEALPMETLAALLDRVARTIKQAPNRVRYVMIGFVISCGTYLAPLGKRAIETVRKIGKVDIDMGDTACKLPDAEDYIMKCRRGAAVAPKRKTIRC